jgi:threonine dehydrogenase-like Zn-dependent dehydrogenase
VKALVYNGPRNVSVSDVPDPRIGRSTDAIVQITRTNICGSDLHMYEGRTNMETGRVLEHDPVEVVMRETNGLGTDRGCECVGYQAHDPQGHEHPNATLNKLVRSVRFTGTIGVVGVYVPADPGGLGELAQHGEVAFGFGLFWFKGQAVGTGQCPVKRYSRRLRDLIHTGKAHPSFIISHELPLERARGLPALRLTWQGLDQGNPGSLSLISRHDTRR